MALPNPEQLSPAASSLTALMQQAGGNSTARDALARRFYEPGGYFDRLVRLVKRDLRSEHYAEDVVQSALLSFCLRLKDGEFPNLPNREHLWKVLVTITRHKAVNALRAEERQKRDRRRTQPMPEESEGGRGLAAPGACPADQVAEKDLLDWLLSALPDRLRKVAEMKLDGCDSTHIEQALNRSRTTVWRDLQTIGHTWQKLLGPLIEGLDQTSASSNEQS